MLWDQIKLGPKKPFKDWIEKHYRKKVFVAVYDLFEKY